MKREPLLADTLLASPNTVLKDSTAAALAAKLREAKRFVLDEEASRYVAEMIRDNPRIVCDAHDFAIPPYETMWVEWPFKWFFSVLSGLQNWDDIRGDHKVGFLIVGPDVYFAGYNKHDNDAAWTPLVIRRNIPWTLDQELAFCDRVKVSRMQLDEYFWGSSYTHLSETDSESVRSLRANHSFDILPINTKVMDLAMKVHGETWFQMLIRLSYGDVRNVIAMLIFLNRTTRLQIGDEVPALSNRMVRRMPRTLLAHRTIRLKIDPKPMWRKMCAGEGVWRRLHDVRGHFCHNRVAREAPLTHEHEWMETRELYWECMCGGHRWWKAEHKRGHKDKGYVASEYIVTH